MKFLKVAGAGSRAIGVVVVSGAMVLTSTGAASAQSTGNYGPTGAVPSVGTKIQGGTAYFQEGPANASDLYLPP